MSSETIATVVKMIESLPETAKTKWLNKGTSRL